MYLCENCGATFNIPDEVNDFSSEFWGATVTHTTCVCPSCGSDDFVEMDRCDMCGEDIAPGEELCENCRYLVDDIANDIKSKCKYMELRYRLKYKELIYHLCEALDKEGK